jgi:protocatechuate 3,4-dioxygenase beta subunit
MNAQNQERREFIKQAVVAALAVPMVIACESKSLAGGTSSELLDRIRRNARPKGAEGMGAIDFPSTVRSKTVLSTETDKGEAMVISGRVFEKDGKTPAPNTLIYLYHTDFEGFYGRKPGEHKHGRYRGWMLTDKEGRYSFISIKPAPYPENRFAAHIHMTVTTPNAQEDWIDSILFEGDPLISSQERSSAGKRGGFNPILTLKKGEDGLLHGTRDIQLM